MSYPMSLKKSVLVSVAIIVSCALMVSIAVSALRMQRVASATPAPHGVAAILDAAGIVSTDQNESVLLELYTRHFEQRWLDLSSIRLSDVPEGYVDYHQMMGDETWTIEIPPAMDVAFIGRRPIFMPIYVVRDPSHSTRMVLPVYGEGMWETIHGFVALSADLNTITGVNFYHQKDTPGIGDKIQAPQWTALWPGKKLYDTDGAYRFSVAGGTRTSKTVTPFQVDGISGATKTTNGVSALIQYWFGVHGYELYLKKVRTEQTP